MATTMFLASAAFAELHTVPGLIASMTKPSKLPLLMALMIWFSCFALSKCAS
jgi:hypothetical protein